MIAGGQDQGNGLDQLHYPSDVLIDNETNSLLIADGVNRQILRWSQRQETIEGEVIVDNISRWRLAIDH